VGLYPLAIPSTTTLPPKTNSGAKKAKIGVEKEEREERKEKEKKKEKRRETKIEGREEKRKKRKKGVERHVDILTATVQMRRQTQTGHPPFYLFFLSSSLFALISPTRAVCDVDELDVLASTFNGMCSGIYSGGCSSGCEIALRDFKDVLITPDCQAHFGEAAVLKAFGELRDSYGPICTNIEWEATTLLSVGDCFQLRRGSGIDTCSGILPLYVPNNFSATRGSLAEEDYIIYITDPGSVGQMATAIGDYLDTTVSDMVDALTGAASQSSSCGALNDYLSNPDRVEKRNQLFCQLQLMSSVDGQCADLNLYGEVTNTTASSSNDTTTPTLSTSSTLLCRSYCEEVVGMIEACADAVAVFPFNSVEVVCSDPMFPSSRCDNAATSLHPSVVVMGIHLAMCFIFILLSF